MVKPIDLMSTQFTDACTQKAGHQKPEQFEGGLKDTLVSSIVAGLEKSSEQTGLAATLTVTNEEPLEIKARPRVEAIIRAGETPSELPFHVAIGLTSPL